MRFRSIALQTAAAMLAFFPGPAASDHTICNVSNSSYDSQCGDIACSRYATTVVVWQEGYPGTIVARARIGTSWQDPVDLGAGHDPVLAYGAAGFTIAYVRGTGIAVRSGNGITWSDPVLFPGDEALRPDLWSDRTGPVDETYLVWDDNSDEIWFARRANGIWNAPEQVETTEMFSDYPTPCVRPRQGPGGIIPRVYYLDYFRIKYCDRSGPTWTEPQEIPTMYGFGTEFEVAEDPFLRHRILTLLPQPS